MVIICNVSKIENKKRDFFLRETQPLATTFCNEAFINKLVENASPLTGYIHSDLPRAFIFPMAVTGRARIVNPSTDSPEQSSCVQQPVRRAARDQKSLSHSPLPSSVLFIQLGEQDISVGFIMF